MAFFYIDAIAIAIGLDDGVVAIRDAGRLLLFGLFTLEYERKAKVVTEGYFSFDDVGRVSHNYKLNVAANLET